MAEPRIGPAGRLVQALKAADDINDLVGVLVEAMRDGAKFDDFRIVLRFLNEVADERAFELVSSELTDEWVAKGVGVEAVDPTLRFMEEHPSARFGSPGPLVHFVERFRNEGYDALLVASVRRLPTPHTVWMLNRAILATTDPDEREALVRVMEEVRDASAAPAVVEDCSMFLKRHRGASRILDG